MTTSTATPPPYPRFDGRQACHNAPDHVFFPTSVNNTYTLAEARRICRSCPLRRNCLRYALAYDLYGIWAGTTRPERLRLQARHGITPTSIQLSVAASGASA